MAPQSTPPRDVGHISAVRPSTVTRAAGAMVAIVARIALAGWTLHAPSLTRVLPGAPPTTP